MCGRFVLKSTPQEIGDAFSVDLRENFPPRYNIAPTQPVGVVLQERGGRAFALMRWGFIASWMKKPQAKPLINARAETVAEKNTFRAAYKRRRCLLPADGYYEWSVKDGVKTANYIRRADERVFGFAGVWETAVDADGGEIDTAAILTTAAGAGTRGLHHREPVVIARGDYARWLETDERDAGDLADLLAAQPAGVWRISQVSSAVNNVRHDGPSLIEPASSERALNEPAGAQGSLF